MSIVTTHHPRIKKFLSDLGIDANLTKSVVIRFEANMPVQIEVERWTNEDDMIMIDEIINLFDTHDIGDGVVGD